MEDQEDQTAFFPSNSDGQHRYFLRQRFPQRSPSSSPRLNNNVVSPSTINHHHIQQHPAPLPTARPSSPTAFTNRSTLMLQYVYRLIVLLLRSAVMSLVCLPRILVATLYDIGAELWTRCHHSVRGFFYGFDIPQLQFSGNSSSQRDADTLDPLTDIIRRFPSHAAWFIKAAMVFGAISGFLLSIPVAIYLDRNWTYCSVCPKPLRWWLLFNCFLQALQVPLRLSFFTCINTLLRSSSQLHHSLSNILPQDDSVADSDEIREVTLPYPTINIQSESLHYRRILSQAPTTDLATARRLARRRHRRELRHLSKRLIRLTNSSAWKFSVWLSIAAYAWFLVGVIWIFSANSATRCCCDNPNAGGRCPVIDLEGVHNNDTEDTLDTGGSTINYGPIHHDIRMVTIVVLIISMSRLIVVLILFFLSLPSRLFSDFPPRMFLHNGVPTYDTALLHLREAFATFDRTPSAVNHYWNQSYNASSDSDISEINNEDELRPYLFRTFNGNGEDDIESLSSDEDPNTTRFIGRRLPIDPPRRRGLSSFIINQLPLMYYSKHVFPRALKSKDSLLRVLERANERRRKITRAQHKMNVQPPPLVVVDALDTYLPLGSQSNPIDIDDETSPLILDAPPTSQQQSRKIKNGTTSSSPTSLLCSFLPRLMKSRSNEFLPDGSSDVCERHLSDRHLNSDSLEHSPHSRSRSRRSPPDPLESSKSSSSSFLPSWKRLKVCFGSGRQAPSHSLRHAALSATLGDGCSSLDFTSELFIGPPLFLASCSICLDDFEENAEIRQLDCRHGFHRQCIDTWLAQVDSCPLCHTPTFSSQNNLTSSSSGFFRRRRRSFLRTPTSSTSQTES